MNQTNPDSLSIHVTEDCGNAPRKIVIRDFNIAYARSDYDYVLEQLTDDVVWQMVGDRTIRGKQDVALMLQQTTDFAPSALHLTNIITHGRTAAANGILTLADSSLSFCDVYIFNSAGKQGKIKEITSYVIAD